jgi:hypothetical protein
MSQYILSWNTAGMHEKADMGLCDSTELLHIKNTAKV